MLVCSPVCSPSLMPLIVFLTPNDSTNGFNLVRLRRVVGRCHQITPCWHLARHDASVKGLSLIHI